MSKLKANFTRKKNYNKNIFIIMTKEMEENIQLNFNLQYFSDVKYYLFVLLAFNKNLYKSILCNIPLISNENIETFSTLLEFLNNIYQFNPKRVKLDFSKAEFTSFKIVFPNIRIIPFFYHFCQV